MNMYSKRDCLVILAAPVLLASYASATSMQEPVYQSVSYTAEYHNLELSSRPGPATASNTSEDSLMKQGYYRIGTAQSVRTVKECYNRECETFPPLDIAPKTEILMAAGTRGGDVVTFTVDNQPSSEGVSKDGKECLLKDKVGHQIPRYDRGRIVGTQIVEKEVCVRYNQIHGTRYLVTSAGHVWRYDPEVAIGNALVAGAIKGDVNWVSEMLPEAPHADVRNARGTTALYSAAYSGHRSIVELLLAHGADPNAIVLGETALRRAAVIGDVETARLLLAHGADVPSEGSLYVAVFFGHTDMVKLLLAAGADVNAVVPPLWSDPEGEPLLSVAQRRGYSDIADILVAAGATPLTEAQSDYVAVAKVRAVIETEYGEIELKFFPKDASTHVENFIELSKKGYFDTTVFSGSARGLFLRTHTPASGTEPLGQTFDAESNNRPHYRSMLSSHPKTVGGFFIVADDETMYLDGQYTVFGEVVSGMDIVDELVARFLYSDERIPMKVTILE